jgi:hypothetical protein
MYIHDSGQTILVSWDMALWQTPDSAKWWGAITIPSLEYYFFPLKPKLIYGPTGHRPHIHTNLAFICLSLNLLINVLQWWFK